MAPSIVQNYGIEKRRDDVMRRVNMGQNVMGIAVDLNITESTVRTDIKARLTDFAKNDESTQEYRTAEGRELMDEIARLKRMAFPSEEFDHIDLKMAALLLKYRERYHKLFGLDIAVKQIIQHRHVDEERDIDDGIIKQYADNPDVFEKIKELNRAIERAQLEEEEAKRAAGRE